MSGYPVLGSDNGYLYRRYGVNDWRKVFDNGGPHSNSSAPGFKLAGRAGANAGVLGFMNDTAVMASVLSADDGVTFAGTTWTNTGFDHRTTSQGANGTIYKYTTELFATSDLGVTWTALGDGGLPSAPRWLIAIGDYLWLTIDGDANLYRCNLDGTGGTAFTGPGFPSSHTYLQGRADTHRLYAFRDFTTGFVVIDISDPDAPGFTSHGDEFGGELVLSMKPVTSLIAIAQTVNAGNTQGSIWRTADDGATWIQVHGPSTQVAGDNLGGDDHNIAVDDLTPTNIWIAGHTIFDFPTADRRSTAWVLYSSDQGGTWTEEQVTQETVPGSITFWQSIGVSGQDACVPVLLLGTDAGSVVRVVDPPSGTDSIVHQVGDGTQYDATADGLMATPSDLRQVWGWDSFGSGNPMVSADGGASWSDPVAGSAVLPLGSVFYNSITQDEAGNLYQGTLTPSIQKSTDQGQTWTDIVSTTDYPIALWASDTHLWWTQNTLGSPSDTTLYRADLDGTNGQSFAGLVPGNVRVPALRGWFGVPRLACYATYWHGGDAFEADLIVIDISDPDAPAATTVTAPFAGATQNAFIQPVTASVAVAYTWEGGNHPAAGSLWQSTDGGLTWSQKVTSDPSLGSPSGNFWGERLLAVDYSNTNRIVAAGLIPDYWYSADRGGSWTKYSVTSDLGDGVEWTSLTIAGTCAGGGGGGEEPPPVRRARVWVGVFGCLLTALGLVASWLRSCGL